MNLIIDIETTMDHKKIHVAVTRNVDTAEVLVWTQATMLRDYLKEDTLLIGHNIVGFDAPILNRVWGTKITNAQLYDTLLVSRLLEPSREGGHSLESWGKRLGLPKMDYASAWELEVYRKQEYVGECFDSPTYPLIKDYCVADVAVTHKLYTRLVEDSCKKGFSAESIAIEHQVAAIITEQERNGFKLDQAKASLLLAEIKQRMGGIQDAMQERWPPVVTERFHKTTGKRLKDSVVEFNPGSRQQIGEKLKELGWVPDGFTGGGQPTVDESVLLSLKFPEAKIIADYLMCQKRVAQIASWLEAVGTDGRIHGKVITNGAVTGRMSHYSPNMAQIPNSSSEYGLECRSCFIVEDGNVLVGIDLSGIELRCLSHYMQDEEWQKELLEGDVHWKNTQAFGLVPMGTVKEDTKEHKDARNVSKTLTYATLYGAGSGKLGSIVGKSRAAGSQLSKNFMDNTPSLKKLKAKVDRISASGALPGLDGRKITVRSEHAALNSLLQSAGAIVAKQWLICLTDNLREKNIKYKLIAFVHDEVCLEASEKDSEEIVKIVVESAAQAGELLKFRCPVGAEGHIGNNWGEVH